MSKPCPGRELQNSGTTKRDAGEAEMFWTPGRAAMKTPNSSLLPQLHLPHAHILSEPNIPHLVFPALTLLGRTKGSNLQKTPDQATPWEQAHAP